MRPSEKEMKEVIDSLAETLYDMQVQATADIMDGKVEVSKEFLSKQKQLANQHRQMVLLHKKMFDTRKKKETEKVTDEYQGLLREIMQGESSLGNIVQKLNPN